MVRKPISPQLPQYLDAGRTPADDIKRPARGTRPGCKRQRNRPPGATT